MTPAQPTPSPNGAPSPANGGSPPAQAQGPSPEQAIQSIQQGFMALGKLIQQAGQNLPSEDLKLFQAAVQATDTMIQSLTGPEPSSAAPTPRQAGGPMAANANAGAKPTSRSGY